MTDDAVLCIVIVFRQEGVGRDSQEGTDEQYQQ